MSNVSRQPVAPGYRWIVLLALLLLASCHERKIYSLALTSTVVSGELLLNSAPYYGGGNPGVNLERGALALAAEALGGDDIDIGALGEGDYQLALLDGSYRSVYRYQQASVLPLPSPVPPTETLAKNDFKPDSVDDFVIVEPVEDAPSELPQNPESILPAVVDTSESSTWDVNVPATTLALQLQLNGADFPSDADEMAQIYLQPENSNMLILLGCTNGPLRRVALTPGRYNVIYQFKSGLRIPKNSHHLLHSIKLENATVANIRYEQVNVQSADIQARFTLDGGDFPNSAYDYGRLFLQNGIDQVPLGKSYEQVTSVSVITGDYSAHYSAREVGSLTPANPDSVISDKIEIDRKTDIVELNVATVSLYGNFLLNGEVPPNSAYEYGRVRLNNPDTGASLLLGNTFAQVYGPLRVIPGNYRCEYELREGGGVVPENQHLILPEVLTVREAPPSVENNPRRQKLDCDIPVVTVTVVLTLNGEPFPNSAYDYADIVMRRVGSDDDIKLGSTFEGDLSAHIVSGDYDFFYRVRESTGQLPLNTRYRFIANKSISQSVTIEHDFETRLIQLLPTLNGRSFPASAYRYAEIAVGSQPEERIFTNDTNVFGKAVSVITGDYSVYYTAKEIGDDFIIPVNKDAKVAEILVE